MKSDFNRSDTAYICFFLNTIVLVDWKETRCENYHRVIKMGYTRLLYSENREIVRWKYTTNKVRILREKCTNAIRKIRNI